MWDVGEMQCTHGMGKVSFGEIYICCYKWRQKKVEIMHMWYGERRKKVIVWMPWYKYWMIFFLGSIARVMSCTSRFLLLSCGEFFFFMQQKKNWEERGKNISLFFWLDQTPRLFNNNISLACIIIIDFFSFVKPQKKVDSCAFPRLSMWLGKKGKGEKKKLSLLTTLPKKKVILLGYIIVGFFLLESI